MTIPRQLPNAITILRILCAPVFVWMLLADGGSDGPLRWWAAVLFIVAIATDGIDGYLARKHDRGLWPRTIEDEGRAFQWSTWAMTELEEPVLTALLNRLVYPEPQRDAAKAADAAQRFQKPLGVLDGQLTGRGYLLGENFTVADLNVAAVLVWAPLAGLDLGQARHAQAWLARCTERPAFRRVQQKSA